MAIKGNELQCYAATIHNFGRQIHPTSAVVQHDAVGGDDDLIRLPQHVVGVIGQFARPRHLLLFGQFFKNLTKTTTV